MSLLRKQRIISWCAIFGYAAFMVTWSLVWTDEQTILSIAFSQRDVFLSRIALIETASSVFLYLAVGVLCCRKRSKSRFPKRVLLALMVLSIVLSGIILVQGWGSLFIYVASGLVGVGVASSMVLWARYYASCDARQATLELSMGNILGLIGYFMISSVISSAIGAVLVLCASVLASALCLGFRLNPASKGDAGTEIALLDTEAVRQGSYRHFLFSKLPDIACITAVGIVWGLLCPALFASEADSLGGVTTAAGVFGSLMILARGLANRSLSSLTKIFRGFFPLMLLGLMPLAVSSDFALGSMFVTYAVITLMSLILILSPAGIACEHNLDPTVVFCTMFGLYTLFTGFRFNIKKALEADGGYVALVVLPVGCIYLLSFVLLWCYNSDIAHLRRKSRREVTLEKELSDDAMLAGVSSEVSTGMVPDGKMDRGDCCRILAAEHHLTSREEEIVQLIASGRSVNAIADRLFLSRNTVQTHYKNIYAKLGIHKKQQLLDMLDEIERRGSATAK